ncbi:hypothetical protein T439DRAFT_364811 [Meredithblackwellia eburnea MCA 4105]
MFLHSIFLGSYILASIVPSGAAPSLGINATCTTDSQCSSGLCYAGQCGAVGLVNLDDGYHCDPSGYVCKTGSYCFNPAALTSSSQNPPTDSAYCAPKIPWGLPCSTLIGTTSCNNTANCYTQSSQSTIGLCGVPNAAYEASKGFTIGGFGSDCSSSGVCSFGTTCQKNAENYNLCEPAFVGSSCNINRDCYSDLCVGNFNRTCLQKTGQVCAVTTPGPDPLCYSGTCGSDLRCAPESLLGDPFYGRPICSTDADCISNAVCSSDRLCVFRNDTRIAMQKPLFTGSFSTIYSSGPVATATGTAPTSSSTKHSHSGTESFLASWKEVIGSGVLALGVLALL